MGPTGVDGDVFKSAAVTELEGWAGSGAVNFNDHLKGQICSCGSIESVLPSSKGVLSKWFLQNSPACQVG